MPTRLVREGLLDSQRYWSVTIEARQLFWHLMLLADDLGCVSLAPAFVRRRCFDDGPMPDRVNLLLVQLSDADLIRIYDVGDARYGFIPRFAQRLKRMTLKHPRPPAAILEGDEDAKEKFQKIIDKTKNPAPDGRPKAALGRREVEVEVEVEVKRSKPSSSSDDEGFVVFWQAYPKRVGKKDALKNWQRLKPDGSLVQAMLISLNAQKQSPDWTKEDRKYVPYPATWLNGRRWEDELITGAKVDDEVHV